jgi:hypothetical protein
VGHDLSADVAEEDVNTSKETAHSKCPLRLLSARVQGAVFRDKERNRGQKIIWQAWVNFIGAEVEEKGTK